MNDWHTMYHEALQIRLVGLALILGVIAPGLWLQHITTREPGDDQLEIAIMALREALVFDLADDSRAAVL